MQLYGRTRREPESQVLMGVDDRRVRMSRDIDVFEFESRPLLRRGFEIHGGRPSGSQRIHRQGRDPMLDPVIGDSLAQPRASAGRVAGPGRTDAPAFPPRPVPLSHSCEGGECTMKAKDYFVPALADRINGEDPTTDGLEPPDQDEAQPDQ